VTKEHDASDSESPSHKGRVISSRGDRASVPIVVIGRGDCSASSRHAVRSACCSCSLQKLARRDRHLTDAIGSLRPSSGRVAGRRLTHLYKSGPLPERDRRQSPRRRSRPLCEVQRPRPRVPMSLRSTMSVVGEPKHFDLASASGPLFPTSIRAVCAMAYFWPKPCAV
jgi:hypothetical protein